MKRLNAFLMCLILLLFFCPNASIAEDEESIENNRVLTALSLSNKTNEEASAALTSFAEADADSLSRASERGVLLASEIRSAMKNSEFSLNGDTIMESAGFLTASNSWTITVDLNGHILYAPQLAYGNYVFKNGIIADMYAENEGGMLKIVIGEDCTVLRSSGQAGVVLAVSGDLQFINYGTVNGIRRMLYQTAGSNKIDIVNYGLVYSDGYALSIRAFHQNSRITLVNEGTIVGLIRGLDVHSAGGSLTAEGNGEILGALGPDIEIPKLTLSCPLTVDDSKLDQPSRDIINAALDPYGDKNVSTGIVFDLTQSKVEYWSTWQITSRIWASKGIISFCLPQNEKIKGKFSPIIAEDSISRQASCVIIMSSAYHNLSGQTVEKELNEFWKQFSMSGFFESGGTMMTDAYSRYAEADGSKRIFFSTADTAWSEILGKRAGNEFTWNLPSNGTLVSREPVEMIDDYYQLKTAVAAADAGGYVVIDRDVDIPEGADAFFLPDGITIDGGGHAVRGELSLSVQKNSQLKNIDLSESELKLSGVFKTGNGIFIDTGTIKSITADNTAVSSAGQVYELSLTVRGGNSVYDIPVRHSITIDVTERLVGSYTFVRDMVDLEENGSVKIIFRQNSLSKLVSFDCSIASPFVEVLILNDKTPDIAYKNIYGLEMLQFYMPYLKMINIEKCKTSDGSRPSVNFTDENGNRLAVFSLDQDGNWVYTE